MHRWLKQYLAGRNLKRKSEEMLYSGSCGFGSGGAMRPAGGSPWQDAAHMDVCMSEFQQAARQNVFASVP